MLHGIYFACKFCIMKKYYIHIIISAMIIWGVYGPATAFSSEDNQYFLEMINKIRAEPHIYARDELDYDPEYLNANGIYVGKKLAPYELDAELTARAEHESKVMAGEEGLASEEKPPIYRLTATTGGVVSFFNFMTQDAAFKIVIDYLLKKEIDAKVFDHILSEAYSHAGLAISAGNVGSGNAWFVAVSLRSSELTTEIQMLNLINQVRSNPEYIWEYRDFNREETLAQKPNLIDSLTSAYTPFFFNAALSASASKIEVDPESGAYHGYEGEIQVSKVGIPCLAEEASRSVDFLFSALMHRELFDWPRINVTFLKGVQDIGSSVAFQPGDKNKISTSVLSFVLGKTDQNAGCGNDCDHNQTSRVYGVLFQDNDENGLYAPGEEILQEIVTAYDDDMEVVQTAVTDNAGHFSMALDSSRQYKFTATINGVAFSWDFPIISGQFVKLACPASIDEY